jgi:hypothetical protein
MTTALSFLFSKGDLTSAQKLLIVQSGPAELLPGVIELLQRTHPEASLSVLLRRGLDELPPALRGTGEVEFIENLGSKLAQVRMLRERAFDGAFVLYTNHPGYWKLKLLPFALGVPSIVGVNENLGWFPVSLSDVKRLSGHMRWRLGSRPGFASADLAEELANAAAAPAKLGYLLAYERLATLRARLAGSGALWKSFREGK